MEMTSFPFIPGELFCWYRVIDWQFFLSIFENGRTVSLWPLWFLIKSLLLFWYSDSFSPIGKVSIFSFCFRNIFFDFSFLSLTLMYPDANFFHQGFAQLLKSIVLSFDKFGKFQPIFLWVPFQPTLSFLPFKTPLKQMFMFCYCTNNSLPGAACIFQVYLLTLVLTG